METKKTGKTIMKNGSQNRFCVEYPEEKLRAIKQFCLKKGICLEVKGAEFLDNLYAKYVPKEVRAYIESDDDSNNLEP